MKRTLMSAALILSAAAPAAWACSAVPPQWALMSEYDRNGDGEMSRAEWRQMPREKNYVLKVADTRRGFAKLDRNRNGRLSMEELADAAEYVRYPCAWWEGEAARMAREAEAAKTK